MKLCIAEAVLLGMVAVSAWGQPQATATPSVSPTPSATAMASPSAADAEGYKLFKDPEWQKLCEAERKFEPGTPEWQRAYEKEKAYAEKVAPTLSAADVEGYKLMKDPKRQNLFEAERKFRVGTPEYMRAYEKEKAYTEKVAPAYSDKIAEEVSIKYLRSGGRSGTIIVARDELAIKALSKAADSHDREGVALMVQSGELFNVPAGTKVRDLRETHWEGTSEHGMLMSKVRILEGEHYSKAGWVPDHWLEDQAPTQK